MIRVLAAALASLIVAAPSMAQTPDVAAPAVDLVVQQQPAPQPPPQGGPRRPAQPNQPRPGAQQPGPPRQPGSQPAQSAPPPPPPPPPPGGARPGGQPINVKIDFTITDQRGSGPALKRTLSVIVADAQTGFVRSESEALGVGRAVPLNVDTSPTILPDGKIRLGFSLQYDWPNPTPPDIPRGVGSVTRTAIHDSVSLILEDGKPIAAAQSADPIGDRQVTVEVKATILK